MALDAKVFGRAAPAQIARDVMSAGSLHTTPAPPQPSELVEHPNLDNWYNAYDSCSEILKIEHDQIRRLKVEEFRSFADSVISSFEEPDTTAQAPTPPANPMPPPIGGLPGSAPPAGPPSAGGLPGSAPPQAVPDAVPSTSEPPPAA